MTTKAKKTTIQVHRVYDEPSPHDGARILVDRLWPRGLSKDKAALDEWCKTIAPVDGAAPVVRPRTGSIPGVRLPLPSRTQTGRAI